MAGRYSQTFTLKDIFNNPNLKGKIPLINYKEKKWKMERFLTAQMPKLLIDKSLILL